MKKTGLLMALLATAGVTSIEQIQAQHISGDQCRLIAEYTDFDFQDLIGAAIEKTYRTKKPVQVDISNLGLHKYQKDLGALALLYTISNRYDYLVEINPKQVLVSIPTD